MKIRGLVIVGALVLVAGAIIAFAWNDGREGALKDEAFGSACRAASESQAEIEACLTNMKQTYAGPLDDYSRLANAAAQHVADYRVGR